ncbi:hypothetical protein AURDEDRAFT_166275 [Auricularia subglabra TFB-10046 SS5]|nr:hypothetical protein AURDEDRAFT_166275 [Auricularia subglabra TFB-10046 SS5]
MNGTVPENQDFSFLRSQLPHLRRGMLERARGGEFLEQFKDSTPAEIAKVAEWQDNMAVFLEVMEERDLETKRAQLLAKLVRALLGLREIGPPLRVIMGG